VSQLIKPLQRFLGLRLREFLEILRTECGPVSWLSVVPLAEFVGRREIAQPFADSSLFFRKAARPETVHEHALAVAARGGFVDALDGNRHKLLHYYCNAARSGMLRGP